MVRPFPAALIGLALAACGSALSDADCRADADCAGAAICDGARCTDPAVLGTPPLFGSARVVLRPADDAVVARGVASRALGATDFLLVGAGRGADAWRSYIRFDFEALRRAGSITRAELRLRTRTDPPGSSGTPCAVGLYLARGPWRSSGLTWENQPGAAGTERAWTVVTGARETEVRLEVGELVSELVRGVSPNHGFVIRARSEQAGARMVAYSSRSPTRRVRPWLEVLHR
ncbi:MAG: DNRLRE domain-containing protein [Deltaproteobacteria bacterium]|nr:DNRLRE domain-containing protein [Deltaproteobacteria bacterium]